MRAIVNCPEPEFPVLILEGSNTAYTITCSDSSIPNFEPVLTGLQGLPWEDVGLLIGALLIACSLATGFNIVGKTFYRG